MSSADTQYLDMVERILKQGYYSNNRTGIPTYKLPHQIFHSTEKGISDSDYQVRCV